MRTTVNRRVVITTLLALVLVVAAVLIGYSQRDGASSNVRIHRPAMTGAIEPAPAAAPTTAVGPDQRGAADSAGSAGSSGSAIDTKPGIAPGDTAGKEASSFAIGSTDVIKTAAMSVGVKNVDAAATSAIDSAVAVGGGVASDVRVAADSSSAATASAQLTLKVPPAQLEPTLTKLATLGVERTRKTSSQDVTGQVADVASRVTSAQASIARLQSLYAKANTVGEIVTLEGQLAQRQAELESLQARQRALAAQTTFATITLSLSSPETTGPAPKDDEDSGFVTAWKDAGRAFTNALGWGLTGLATVLPFALVLALAGWVALVVRRRLTRPEPGPATAGPTGTSAPTEAAGQPAN